MRNWLEMGLQALVLASALATPSSFAQTYPAKPVRVLVPLSPGSQADIVSRIVAQKMSEDWGQQVVVDNRPGGAGGIAGGILVKAPADGHTLMIYSDGHAVNAALNAALLPFDTLRDIARVSLVASFPSVLVVAPSLRVNSVKELIALAKANPGKLSFGSAGIGGGLHFSGELFKMAAGIDTVHVPYKGVPEAVMETMTGRIQYTFASMGPVLPFIKDSRVLALAVGSAQRSALLPSVPTVAEAALPGFAYDLWNGLFAPAATPRAIIEQLNHEISRIMNLSEVRERLAGQGVMFKPNTPEEFDRFVRTEVEKLRNVIKVAGIKPGA